MKRFRRIALLLVGLLAVLVLATGFLTRGHTADQSASRSFTLDHGFDRVKRVLRQKGVSTAILNAAGTSEFVSEAWSDTDLGFDGFAFEEGRPKLDLSFARQGTLEVRVLNEAIGSPVITLDRRVELAADHVDSKLRLREGTERLVGYDAGTRFAPTDDGKTEVILNLRQAVRTRAPFFLAGVADRRVREAAEASLDAQERAIREVVEARVAALPEDDAEAGEEGPLKKLLRGLLDR